MRIPRLVRAAIAALTIAAALGTSTASAGDIVVRRDGSKAVDVPAVAVSTSDDTADGFDIGDAGVGAAGMLALALGVAGAVSLRGRRHSMGDELRRVMRFLVEAYMPASIQIADVEDACPSRRRRLAEAGTDVHVRAGDLRP